MAKARPEIGGTICEQIAALPWRVDLNGKVQILLVTSRTNGKWMLPKGWPLAEMSPAYSAGVEAKEEAGVEGVVSEKAIGSYHYIKMFDDGTSTPAQAVIYPMLVTAELSEWDEKNQRTRRWFRPKEAAQAVFEPDLKRFILDLREDALVLFAS